MCSSYPSGYDRERSEIFLIMAKWGVRVPQNQIFFLVKRSEKGKMDKYILANNKITGDKPNFDTELLKLKHRPRIEQMKPPWDGHSNNYPGWGRRVQLAAWCKTQSKKLQWTASSGHIENVQKITTVNHGYLQ